ncbi:MAG: acyloxyacyl hydrolase [Candidatus Rokuibacteriota bacterium]
MIASPAPRRLRALFFAATLASLLAAGGAAQPARAFDARQTLARGACAVSVEGGYGEQFDLWNPTIVTGFEFLNAGVRLGFFPWDTMGSGVLAGAVEIGLEPFYQRFVDPVGAFFAGLVTVARYHFTTLGRVVPYADIAAGAGGTDLGVWEQDTDFEFLLFAGAGASYFITERTALYAGYRLQHISNAGTASPNRGINSHTAVLGVSVFFR